MPDHLGDARRANGARIEGERRAIGTRIERERRAIGKRIERERRGAAVQEEINSLIRPVSARPSLRPVDPVGALPALRGRADYKAPPAATTGGGIVGPLVEVAAEAREHYPEQLLPTTDGMVWIRWKSIKKVVMVDANSAEVSMEFKNGV